METVVKRLYEAMFLVDSAKAASDWDALITTIKNLLERAEAEIVSIRKWEERKLAYEIQGKSRGTYILCYFSVDGEKIRDIERDVQLSERIMRVLILSAVAMEQKDIEKDTPAMRVEKREQEAAKKAESAKKKAESEQKERDSLRETSQVVTGTERAEESLEPEVNGQETGQVEELEQSATEPQRNEEHPETTEQGTAKEAEEPEKGSTKYEEKRISD